MCHWITSFSCRGLAVGACRPPEPGAPRPCPEVASIVANGGDFNRHNSGAIPPRKRQRSPQSVMICAAMAGPGLLLDSIHEVARFTCRGGADGAHARLAAPWWRDVDARGRWPADTTEDEVTLSPSAPWPLD